MKNLTKSIDLQLEKLNVIRLILKHVDTEDDAQSTGRMLKAIKEDIEELIKNDF